MGGTEPRANARGRGRAEGRPSVKDKGQRGRSMTQGRRRGQREEPEGKEDRDRSRCLVHSGGRTAWRQQRLDTLWLEPGLRAPAGACPKGRRRSRPAQVQQAPFHPRGLVFQTPPCGRAISHQPSGVLGEAGGPALHPKLLSTSDEEQTWPAHQRHIAEPMCFGEHQSGP